MKPWTLNGSEILEDDVAVIVVRHEWFDQEEDSKRWQFTPVCKARARLAAAAPRLLAACEKHLELFETYRDECHLLGVDEDFIQDLKTLIMSAQP